MGFFKDRQHKYIASELYSEFIEIDTLIRKATSAVRSSTYLQIITKINKLIPELDNINGEGKFSLGGVLTKRGMDALTFDIAEGSSTWIVGASLITTNMSESLNQEIVKSEVTRIMKDAVAAAKAAIGADEFEDDIPF